MVAAVTLEQPSARVQNVVIQDMATIGISALREDILMDHVTVTGSGMLGIHGRFADRLVLNAVDVHGNNDEHFNMAPSAGGVKLGQTRTVTVRNSIFSGNYAHGFWIDMSVYNISSPTRRSATTPASGSSSRSRRVPPWSTTSSSATASSGSR